MSKRGGWFKPVMTVPGSVAAASLVLAALTGAGYVPQQTAGASTPGPVPRLTLVSSDGSVAASSTSPARSAALSKTSLGRMDVRPSYRTPAPLPAKPAKKVVKRKAVTVKAAARKASPKKAVVSRASSSGWRSARVSWYGPGFYGHTMAGGGKLTPGSMVVAHRSLPFGTRIQFSYKGRTCTAVVMDRGPFVGGRTFDLGPGTAQALGFGGVGTVQYRIL